MKNPFFRTLTIICGLAFLGFLSSGTLIQTAIGADSPSSGQPQPSPEHKRLEMLVGIWSYQGVGSQTPFWPAGKFAGKTTTRLILNGLFTESRWQDTNSNGYVASGLIIQGYEAAKKTYISHAFENDGSASIGATSLQGNTWLSRSTRTGLDGKVYLTMNRLVFAPDGRSMTEKHEYSVDNGRTWLPAYEAIITKTGE